MTQRAKLVIDPGHGGQGAVGGSSPNHAKGTTGILEKDLTLDLARLVRDRLSSDMDVVLTREDDSNLSLAERADFAKRNNADLFLSIHFNGAEDTTVDGTEAWISRHPNAASRRFARSVVDCLLPITGVRDRGVREADFGVLLPSRHASDTAACLVEVAFLTNPQESTRLADPAYMARLADALATAVRQNLHAAAPTSAAQALGVGMRALSGNGHPPHNGHSGLAEPADVNDERFSYVPSVRELETLFGATLDSGNMPIMTVIDADAWIRTGPPKFKATHHRIPRFTRVQVQETQGDYSRVSAMDGSDIGWTVAANLVTLFKDTASLASAALAPATAITIDASWPADTRKQVAEVFNRLGGLLQALSTATNIDVAAALATWRVESNGAAHTVGSAIIRFENHLFFDRWGHSNASDFDDHFKFGTRPPETGTKCTKRWKCHFFRADSKADWENVHKNQQTEYAALEVATHLSDADTALPCISIGGPQILVSNFALLGYGTAQEMYDAFQADERAQVLGFFDFCNLALARAGLLNALQRHDWHAFAVGYNGSGRAQQYASDLQNAFNEATAALATLTPPAPTKTQALEDGGSVSISYPVELIPQPTKQSCWAGSMAMLVSYSQQRSVSAEDIALAVGRSLRTSYGWDMLEEVKDHFGFKEIALPSNLSFVPTPAQWYDWLSKYGPLWITVTGAPSHAIVVHGISGDLTTGGTTIEVLNPWDINTAFDADPIDFHPENHGVAYARQFNSFASEFGNMGLADYGNWRVLYIGKPSAAAKGLALTPEELADAELVHGGYIAGAADVLNAIPLRALHAYPLSRNPLGLADVRWAADANSPDYRHLGAAGQSGTFAFTPTLLDCLCRVNRFDVTAGQDQVLFGLRGCILTDGKTNTGWVTTANLSESVPDHNDFQCVLGVWKRSTGQFNLFKGSTVPNWKLMETYRQGGAHCNLLPTGRYILAVGTHRKGTKGEIRGAFREHEEMVVLRTIDDLEYTISDTWDSGFFGDNIHPARLDGRSTGPFFSSAGCQTIPGNYKGGRHTGIWADFREAAGLTVSAPDSENGTLFVFTMFTGREARLSGTVTDANDLGRLRFGSSGDEVRALQQALISGGAKGLKASGRFDARTKIAYLDWQKQNDASTADGIVTPANATSLNAPLTRISITATTQSLGYSRTFGAPSPTADQVVAQFDGSEGTFFGSYDGYVKSLSDTTVFGQLIRGLHPTFLAKLRRAEKELVDDAAGGAVDWGITSASGLRRGDGWHNWGLAVDLNYSASPYIMHERHEGALDRELAPVYERIAQLLLARSSAIPTEITQGAPLATRTAQLYDKLKEESDAMVDYFALMQDPAALAKCIAAFPADKNWSSIGGGASAPSADALQALMMQDYVTLAGRSGPAVGRDYPAPTTSQRDDGRAADRPFVGDPSLRAPEKGFLSLHRDLVIALSRAGLRWGAIDFGPESGDVMHFDDGNGNIAGKLARARRAAQSALATGQGLSLTLDDTCSSDLPIDDARALLFSPAAPLAGLADCDERAVWTYLPNSLPSAFSVLLYLHGMNNIVVVDAAHPGGRSATWAPKQLPPALTKDGPTASGPKYQLDDASQNSPQKPFVVVPEVGAPAKKAWSHTRGGKFAEDRGSVLTLIDDCWGRLASLQKPSGGPYVSGGAVCPDVKRLFLAGHSAGGRPLGYACTSVLASTVPTDLWLLDCTYNFGVDDHYIEFCRTWKAWVDPSAPDSDPQDRLGNDQYSSRMVVITTQNPDTTDRASKLINTLTSPWKSSRGTQPGLTALKYANGKLSPRSGSVMPSNAQIIEIVETHITQDIEQFLQQYPIVFIHPIPSGQHDYIPRDWIPVLLRTAASPS